MISLGSKKKCQDEVLIDLLEGHGSNVNKPHQVKFNLDFKSEGPCYSTSDRLRNRGYEVPKILLS